MTAAFIGVLCLIFGTILGCWIMSGQPNYSSYERVLEFHKAFGQPSPGTPELLDESVSALRIELIREELEEYMEAVAANDIVAIADALGDLDYVVNGAAIAHGIVLPVITAEIHRSNMTKLGPDGAPIYREDGKILKGEGYEPPKLEPFLA